MKPIKECKKSIWLTHDKRRHRKKRGVALTLRHGQIMIERKSCPWLSKFIRITEN